MQQYVNLLCSAVHLTPLFSRSGISLGCSFYWEVYGYRIQMSCVQRTKTPVPKTRMQSNKTRSSQSEARELEVHLCKNVVRCCQWYYYVMYMSCVETTRMQSNKPRVSDSKTRECEVNVCKCCIVYGAVHVTMSCAQGMKWECQSVAFTYICGVQVLLVVLPHACTYLLYRKQQECSQTRQLLQAEKQEIQRYMCVTMLYSACDTTTCTVHRLSQWECQMV